MVKNEEQIIQNCIEFIKDSFAGYSDCVEIEHLCVLVDDNPETSHHQFRITNTTNDKFLNVDLETDTEGTVFRTERGEDLVEIDEHEFVVQMFLQHWLTLAEV